MFCFFLFPKWLLLTFSPYFLDRQSPYNWNSPSLFFLPSQNVWTLANRFWQLFYFLKKKFRSTSLSGQQETRVANLESRLQELSETVGTYDRLRQNDQMSMQKLRDRIAQLDLENQSLQNVRRNDSLPGRLLYCYTYEKWLFSIITYLCRFSDNLWLFCKDHFSIYYIKSFNLATLCDLVTVFVETKSVTKSRLHCICWSRIQIKGMVTVRKVL